MADHSDPGQMVDNLLFVERQLLREQEQCAQLERRLAGFKAEAKKMSPKGTSSPPPRYMAPTKRPTQRVKSQRNRAGGGSASSPSSKPQALQQKQLSMILESKNRRIVEQKQQMLRYQHQVEGEIRAHQRVLAQKETELERTSRRLQVGMLASQFRCQERA